MIVAVVTIDTVERVVAQVLMDMVSAPCRVITILALPSNDHHG
jgi:hypothetical protein